MIYDKVYALKNLKPNKQFVWRGTDYSGLEWLESDTAPTESELDAEVTRLNNAEPMRLLREERFRLLAECDWTQGADVPNSIKTAWQTYRQQLRDLPASASPKLDEFYELDLSSVTWPTKPS